MRNSICSLLESARATLLTTYRTRGHNQCERRDRIYPTTKCPSPEPAPPLHLLNFKSGAPTRWDENKTNKTRMLQRGGVYSQPSFGTNSTWTTAHLSQLLQPAETSQATLYSSLYIARGAQYFILFFPRKNFHLFYYIGSHRGAESSSNRKIEAHFHRSSPAAGWQVLILAGARVDASVKHVHVPREWMPGVRVSDRFENLDEKIGAWLRVIRGIYGKEETILQCIIRGESRRANKKKRTSGTKPPPPPPRAIIKIPAQ